MKKIINTRIGGPDSEVLEGYRELLKVYSPSCVVADAQERAGVMRSYLRSLTTSTRFVGPALTVRLEPGNQVDCLDAQPSRRVATRWSWTRLARPRPPSGAG